MSVNTLVTNIIDRNSQIEEERLPALIAGLLIFGLSLLCWAPIVLPIIAFVHR